MGIAIAIVAVVALAVIGLVVTARSRATTGRLSRETRKRDEAAAEQPAEVAAGPQRRDVDDQPSDSHARADRITFRSCAPSRATGPLEVRRRTASHGCWDR